MSNSLSLCESLQSCQLELRRQPGQNEIWQAIKDNGIKDNPDYSAYNFRNKKQEDHYKETGKLPVATPSIYNERAVDFVVKLLKNQE